jgi:hypothetical protein
LIVMNFPLTPETIDYRGLSGERQTLIS